jgi:hypothetical protein
MAISVITANEVTSENSANNPATLQCTSSHTLSQPAGNDRLVLMLYTFTEVNNGTAPIALESGSPSYNAVAPTGSITSVGDDSGAHNAVVGICWWDDGDLPATATSSTAQVTATGTSGRMIGGMYVVEMTGVDQTTPKASEGTNTAFGTANQSSDTLLSDAGDVQWTICSGGADALGIDVVSNSDNERYDNVYTSGGNRMVWAVGYATDGTIVQNKSNPHEAEQIAMIGINAAGAATWPRNAVFGHPIFGPMGGPIGG